MNRILARAIVVLALASFAALPAFADATCSSLDVSGMPFSCVMPEPGALTPEVSATFTLAGDTFSASATGIIELFDADGTTLSDFATFTNVGGIATVVFVSDTEGVVLIPQDLPVIGKFTEGNPISISVGLTSGATLNATLCSDADEGTSACGGSDSISLSQTAPSAVVPEPGTLALAALGLLALGPMIRTRFGS